MASIESSSTQRSSGACRSPCTGGAGAKDGTWWWFPWGNAPRAELQYEALNLKLPELRRERFVGWASEIHLLYTTTEVALFTLLCWPGWTVPDGPWFWGIPWR